MRPLILFTSQIIDPFVEVEIIGLPVDCCKEQTRVVDDNGNDTGFSCYRIACLFSTEYYIFIYLYISFCVPLNAGFNPVWEETLSFTLHMPEVALVRFLVWDHDPIGRDFVGQRTVAFTSLMPGKRRENSSVFSINTLEYSYLDRL